MHPEPEFSTTVDREQYCTQLTHTLMAGCHDSVLYWSESCLQSTVPALGNSTCVDKVSIAQLYNCGVLATLCLTGAEGTDGRGAVYTQRVPLEPYLCDQMGRWLEELHSRR